LDRLPGKVVGKIVSELLSGSAAPTGILVEALEANGLEVLRNAGVQTTRRHGVGAQDLRYDFVTGVDEKRRATESRK
jgi:hypothetical protein